MFLLFMGSWSSKMTFSMSGSPSARWVRTVGTMIRGSFWQAAETVAAAPSGSPNRPASSLSGPVDLLRLVFDCTNKR
jgi:hypothetical protein